MWLELWQLRSQSTQTLFCDETKPIAEVQEISQFHLDGKICTIENQSWAVQDLACTCTCQNEPCVTTGHTISTNADCISAQVREVEHTKAPRIALKILPEATSAAVETALDAHRYTRTADQSITLPQCLSWNSSENVHQTVFSSLHLTKSLPTCCLHHAGSSTRNCLWCRKFLTSNTLWAFQYHVTISGSRRPQTSVSWDPEKWSWVRTFHTHAASRCRLPPLYAFLRQAIHVPFLSYGMAHGLPKDFPLPQTSLPTAFSVLHIM